MGKGQGLPCCATKLFRVWSDKGKNHRTTTNRRLASTVLAIMIWFYHNSADTEEKKCVKYK